MNRREWNCSVHPIETIARPVCTSGANRHATVEVELHPPEQACSAVRSLTEALFEVRGPGLSPLIDAEHIRGGTWTMFARACRVHPVETSEPFVRTTQQTSITAPSDVADVARGKVQRVLCSLAGTLAIWTLAACQQPAPSPSIGVGNPYPVSNYVCDGTRLAVRLMGDSASVSVDGAAAIDLPAIGKSGTTFSNGRQTMLIEQGRTSWAVGRAMPVACTGG